MPTLFRYFALCALLILPTAHAAQPKPAFLQPEVLKAAMAINMTEAQKPQFQAALTKFMEARMSAVKKLMGKRNQTNLPRKIKSKTRALLQDMDNDMATFLTAEQLPAYQVYRERLQENLRGF